MSIFRGFGTHSFKYVISRAGFRHGRIVRTFFVYVCVLVVLPAISTAQSIPDPAQSADTRDSSEVELEQAVTLALDHSLELASIRAHSDAIRAASSYAGALPDPTLSLTAMNMPTDTFSFDQEPMTQMQVALSQSFPFPGKRKLRREAVEYQASASDQMETERRSAIIGDVRIAWWQLMSLDRALQIVEQNKDLMRNFVQIAQTKYRVGSGLQQDVLLAQLELSRLLARELRLQGMRRSSRARLNSLMNRPADWALDLPASPRNTALPELRSERQLLQQAETDRALIDVQRDLVDSANASLELARKDRWPDFKLGVGYGFRQGYDPLRSTDRSDLLTVMLSINVPLYSRSKQTKAVEQRAYEVSRQTLVMQNTLRGVEAAVSENLANYLSARDQVLLLDTAIIPQAQQTVSSMLAGYQVNEVDFLNLVNTQITLYNAQINYWESLSTAKQALAKLASAIGVEALYE
jgi:cobalt-zinc-cadmium efflux system outer membrane protein